MCVRVWITCGVWFVDCQHYSIPICGCEIVAQLRWVGRKYACVVYFRTGDRRGRRGIIHWWRTGARRRRHSSVLHRRSPISRYDAQRDTTTIDTRGTLSGTVMSCDSWHRLEPAITGNQAHAARINTYIWYIYYAISICTIHSIKCLCACTPLTFSGLTTLAAVTCPSSRRARGLLMKEWIGGIYSLAYRKQHTQEF